MSGRRRKARRGTREPGPAAGEGRPPASRQPTSTGRAGARKQPASRGARGPAWSALPPVLIVVAGVAAYWSSFDGAFVLDDTPHIPKNPRLQGGSLAELLAVERPVVELSLALNYALHGTRVWGYHLVNLVVHLLAGLTLFGIVRRSLELPALASRYRRRAPGLALAAALLWVVHPLQTQSVTYLIQRGESMMGLGYLLALYCLIRSAAAGDPLRWTLAGAASAVFGMGAKAIFITAPALLLLYDRIFLASTLSELWRRRWRFHVGVIAAVLIMGFSTAVIPGFVRTTANVERDDYPAEWRGRAFSPSAYYAAQPGVILHYVKLAFWPRVLVLDYKWAPVEDPSEALVPAACLLALLALTAWALLRAPPLGFVGAWFFVILAPTSAYWKLELCFEHRMYLSLAAPIVLTVLAVHAALNRALGTGARAQTVGAVALAAVALALGSRTALRNLDYESEEKMIRADLRVRPENDRLHFNLANGLRKGGKNAESIPHYLEAIRLQPANTSARINLATAYNALGRHGEAAFQLGRVLEVTDSFVALSNMANTLLRYAAKLKLDGKTEEATSSLRNAVLLYARALEKQPEHHKSLRGLGFTHTELGEYPEAEDAFRRALEQEPNDSGSLGFLGHSLLRQGRLDEAEPYLRRALEVDPPLPEAEGWLDQLARARADRAAEAGSGR